MEAVFNFLRAALPWIAVGLLLAVFASRGAMKKKEQTGDYGTEGICLGMCFGTALGAAFGNNIAFGIVNKSAWHMNTILQFTKK